ncbi:MAG: cytidine deaminase [Candidatus Riflebacteria bacterium]|nr:cytidine deaminase [Candidatus Riflebacteria bacterium]
MIMEKKDKELIENAVLASTRAYAPYSKFKVGAALRLSDGQIILGCNVENASYGLTNCAERTAVFSAVAMGRTDFDKLAIYVDSDDFISPCGACRQVLVEFSSKLKVMLINRQKKVHETTAAELLPMGFTKENLNQH